jgi:hypothetical protein
VEAATGLSVDVAGFGRDLESVAERKAERAVEAIGRVAKRQAGNVDPTRQLVIADVSGSERRSGEFGRRASLQQAGRTL